MFRKNYPWLNSPWVNNINEQNERLNFLSLIDNFVNQKQYVRITLLNWNEDGIKEIAGELTSGTITKDGASSVRRTATLNATVSGGTYSVEDANMDFAINKKVFIEIGIENKSPYYTNYPIIYFPQGIFFISSFNISSSATTTVNIALQLKDKMASLNGDVGGVFPATTILDEMDTQLPDGTYATKKVLVIDIISEVVNHIGGELLTNIVVEDVPPRIQRVMQWNGENPLWMKRQGDINSGIYYEVEVEQPPNLEGWDQFNKGDDVGYIFDDFVYSEELVAAPGDSVTSVLDKLIQYLGNYEYFYDEFGVFHFREIKDYMNTTQASIVEMAQQKQGYLVDITTGKSVFNFSDDQNLINITANPQYGNVKNDYVVQGLRKMTTSDISYPVIYHLAIDYKPKAGNTYRDLFLYKSPTDGLIKGIFPLHVDELPEVGNFNIFYMLNSDTSKCYFWSESNEYIEIEPIKYYSKEEGTDGYITKDWRTEIYLRGLLARDNGTDASQYYTNLQNHKQGNTAVAYQWIDDLYNVTKHEKVDVDFYYEEMNAFWPEIYDLENQKFWAEEEADAIKHTALTEGNYFLDFIDPSTSGLGQFAVSAIGRRTQVTANDQINCLFEPDFPDINFINIDEDDADELREECMRAGKPFSQIRGEIFYAMSTGGYHYGAFDEIKYQLYLHTNYATTLSLIAIPAFYLEPNSRVTINDASTNTYGDYMISTISIPLGPGSSMSVSASEVNMDRYF